MNSSKKDYNKLYHLQDKFLAWWLTLELPFYLTGGTALGRFYLNHRCSEDLDFFINNDSQYQKYISELKNKITARFTVNLQQTLFADDFTRFYIAENDTFLKIELVNDVAYYTGTPAVYPFGMIDTPLNILANKLAAIVGRDEPKDIFDVIHLSLAYSFNWLDIFYHAKQKTVINELDVEQRLISFPVEWLENVNWLKAPLDYATTRKTLRQIADDFLLGLPNSLGKDQIPIELAKPLN
ncbi:MAG: nucleotidyl transferase AbiEii/AbiGii toxin family protein [Acidobacteria bacterium]|nr:nucleotidyl transferase AbiEii/AbiGii toxin family protein [Acidobacteriota bacterium]